MWTFSWPILFVFIGHGDTQGWYWASEMESYGPEAEWHGPFPRYADAENDAAKINFADA